MKKTLTVLLIFFLSSFLGANSENINSNVLQKGSFIPVYPTKTLSTSVLEEGETVYFIVPSDMWFEEFKIIPKNSIIKAKITELKMPVTGINAMIKLKAEEIAFPNGHVHYIEGDVAYKGEVQIGGDLTAPLSYNTSMHPMKGEYFNGAVLQYVPSGKYEYGQHITLHTNEIFYVILTEDFTPL